MELTEQRTDELTSLLTVKISPEDYGTKIESGLRETQKKINMPGFRPGKVPTGLIRKMYGQKILLDEVNNIIQASLEEFIKTNDLNLIGDPIAYGDRDFELIIGNEFEFVFQIGKYPTINVHLEEEGVFDYPLVTFDDKMIEQEVKRLQSSFGTKTHPDMVEDKDIISGKFEQLDDEGSILEGGINKETNVNLEYINDAGLKNIFIGLAKNTSVVFDPHPFSNSDELASVLRISHDEVETLSSKIKFTLNDISRIVPAEFNKEFMNKVYGEDVNTEEEFREKTKQSLNNILTRDRDAVFVKWALKKLTENANFTLPEDFLKRWMIKGEKGEGNIEKFEKDFPKLMTTFKIQLLTSKLMEQYDTKNSEEELKRFTKEYLFHQFQNMGIQEPTEEMINSTTEDFLNDKKQKKKLQDELFEVKLTNLLKSKLRVNNVEVPYDTFYHKH